MLWSAWYPYILTELPNAPTPVVDHYVRQTAISFFEETQVWTIDLTAINIVASTGTYALVAPAQTITASPLLTEIPDIAMVKWAWVNGQQIFPTSQEELNALVSQWATVESGNVTHYTQLTQDSITLYPIPNFALTSGLTIKVAVQPALDATGVPDWLGNKYIQTIAAGAKSGLMGMVGKPWSTPEGEAKYADQYAKALTKASVEGNRSFTRSTMIVRMPRYG